jgi:hypothetical protein
LLVSPPGFAGAAGAGQVGGAADPDAGLERDIDRGGSVPTAPLAGKFDAIAVDLHLCRLFGSGGRRN